MSDQAMSDDERELVRLVDSYAQGFELGLASYDLKEDLDKILAHYRKAKADLESERYKDCVARGHYGWPFDSSPL